MDGQLKKKNSQFRCSGQRNRSYRTELTVKAIDPIACLPGKEAVMQRHGQLWGRVLHRRVPQGAACSAVACSKGRRAGMGRAGSEVLQSDTQRKQTEGELRPVQISSVGATLRRAGTELAWSARQRRPQMLPEAG